MPGPQPLETKVCTRCGEEQSLRRFRWLKKHHRGRPEVYRDSWCSDCRRDYKREPSQKTKTLARVKRRRLTDSVWREKENQKSRAYYAANRDKCLATCHAYRLKKSGGNLAGWYRGTRIKKKFGITLADYEAMCIAQDYKCAICGAPDTTKLRRLAIDHDHKTKLVRALLCHHCNTGLGNFRDDIGLMWKAMQYLAKHQPKLGEAC